MKNVSLQVLTAVVCCGVSASLMAEDKKAAVVQAKPAVQTKQVTKDPVYKLGTWDMHANLSNSKSSKDAQDKITALQNQLAAPIEEKRQKSAKRLEEFNSKKDVLTKDAREKEEKELLALSRELQAEVQKAQELVRVEVNKETEALARDAEAAAVAVAKAKDLDILIEKNTGRVTYEKSNSLDITAQVQAKMDKDYATKLAQNKKADAKDAVKTASATPAQKTATVKA